MRGFIKILLGLYALYLALVFLVAMPVMNFGASWFMDEHYQRTLRTELILFNPFSLNLEVRGAQLDEPNSDEPFASFERANVNLSVESLWRPGIVLDEVGLEGLTLHLRRESDGQLNIADFSSSEPPSDTPDEEPLPALTIHHLSLDSHRITITDAQHVPLFTTHWDGLAIAVDDFTTIAEEGHPYHLRATGEEGGELIWEGDISLPSERSRGTLTLNNLSLNPLWRYVQPWVKFDGHDGRLKIALDYDLNWAEGLSYEISNGTFKLSGPRIENREGGVAPDTSLALGALSVEDIHLKSETQAVQIGSIVVDALDIQGWMDEQTISLQALLEPVATDPATAAPVSPPDGPEPPWRAEVAKIELQNSSVDWRTPYTDPPRLHIRELNAQLEDLRWPLAGNSPITVSATVEDSLTLAVTGGLSLAEGDGEFQFDLAKLPMPWFNPLLPAALSARIGAGDAGSIGKLALIDFKPVSLAMDGGINDFSVEISEAREGDSITSWKSVKWEGLAVDLAQQSVALDKLLLNQYAGRLHIFSDGTINTQRALRQESEAAAAAKAAAAAEEDAEDTKKTAADSPASPPWNWSLSTIDVADSQIDFMDESLPITFRTIIGDLNGSILGLSNSTGQTVDVDLKGSVDGYAPVTIAGKGRPFDSSPMIDLAVTFDGVDLARLTPYSSTYAGYAIKQGVLDMTLEYALDKGQLEGDNRIVIDQLKLGEQVESDKAVDLPLELAIALLTNLDGVIDLEVPVRGDVNDPEFQIGSVIATAFVNLITKAATAPFKLLAGLVGSDEDLQRITFTSGSSELDEHAQTKLTTLGEALVQRPGIKLSLAGHLHPQADREALQKQALRQELLSSGLSEADLEEKSPAWEKAIAKRYLALGEPPADEAQSLPPREQQARLAAARTVPASQLDQLRKGRVDAVRGFLIAQAGVAADRLQAGAEGSPDSEQSFSGVELATGT